MKDLLQLDDAALDKHPITPLVRPATFVPETKRVPELLKDSSASRCSWRSSSTSTAERPAS